MHHQVYFVTIVGLLYFICCVGLFLTQGEDCQLLNDKAMLHEME